MHCGRFSSISGLSPLDAISAASLPSTVTTESVSGHCQTSLQGGGIKWPLVRTIDIDLAPSSEGLSGLPLRNLCN